jgi:2'-5' RNA ligase
MRFCDYLELTEKVMSGDESKSLYIAVEFDKKQVQKFYDMIDLSGDSIEEVETNPHATILYSREITGISKESITEILTKLWRGVTFDVRLQGYSVFEGVNRGTQDVLIMELGIEDVIYRIQEQIVPALKAKGAELKISYPEWKPHMTIAYVTQGEVPVYPENLEAMTIKPSKIFLQFGGSDTEKIVL